MPGGSGGRRNSPRASASAEPGWTWWKSAGLEGRLCWHDMDLSDASLSGMLPRPESQRLVDWLTDGAIIPKAFKGHWLHVCFCRIPTWDPQSDIMKTTAIRATKSKIMTWDKYCTLVPRCWEYPVFMTMSPLPQINGFFNFQTSFKFYSAPSFFLPLYWEVTTLQTFLYQAGPRLNLYFGKQSPCWVLAQETLIMKWKFDLKSVVRSCPKAKLAILVPNSHAFRLYRTRQNTLCDEWKVRSWRNLRLGRLESDLSL